MNVSGPDVIFIGIFFVSCLVIAYNVGWVRGLNYSTTRWKAMIDEHLLKVS